MKRKEVKRLLKEHPEFESWLKEDETRAQSVRRNPGTTEELFKRWNDRKKGKLDFDSISQKTKRASEMLNGVQNIMDMMADYTKKM
ncbi:hypothetical protein [Brevibacillus nitrificans]|uniref:hypothetical protein n=1 Tax=Brevibacillus nitrificans TaxID=651560 RepID=UPI00285A728B|nr:hypothetical protein [Brevibacillus nitrificans]MDR7316484.1 hypothetical protein [Brevibacillus nitrificans]